MAFDPKRLAETPFDPGTEEAVPQATTPPQRLGKFDPNRLKTMDPEAGSGVTTLQKGGGVVDGESAGASIGKDAIRHGLPLLGDLATMPLTGGMRPLARHGIEAIVQGIIEAGMQGTGLNELSGNQFGMAMGSPVVGGATGQGAGYLFRKGVSLLPGVEKGARTALTPEARLLAGQVLETPATSKELYEQLATQSGSKARLTEFPQLEAAAKKIQKDLGDVSLEQLQKDLRTAGLGNLVDDILNIRAGKPAVYATRPPKTVSGGRPVFPTTKFPQLGEGVYASTSEDIAQSYAKGQGPLNVAQRPRTGRETVSKLIIPHDAKIFEVSDIENPSLLGELRRDPKFATIWDSEYRTAPPTNNNLWDASKEAGLDLQKTLQAQGFKGAAHPNYGGSKDYAIWDQSILDTKGEGITLFRGGEPPTIPARTTLPIKGTGLPSQLEEITPAQAPGMTFANAKANIEGMGKMIANTSDDEKRGAYKEFYSKFLGDMENMEAPTGTPVELWKKARQAYKTEKSRLMLLDAIEKNAPNKGGVQQFNADGLLNWMKNNKEFVERFKTTDEKAQLKIIQDQFTEMAKLAGNNPQRLSGMLAGMAVMHSAGGALAGYAAADVMSKALMTEEGGKLALKILRKSGPSEWYHRGGSALAVFVSSLMSDEGPVDPFKEGQTFGVLPSGEVRADPKPIERSPVPAAPLLTPEDIKAKVTKAAKDTKLDPKLFHAVVSTESNYNPSAVSPVGAVGLTQLMPKTAAGLGVNPLMLDENLKGGATYLQSLIKKYDGDVGKALAAYNAGPGRVDKGGPLPQETQSYVAKIMMKLRGDKRD